MKTKIFILSILLGIFTINSAQNNNSEFQGGKSELLAGLIEFVVPVVGHAYAGDATKGILPTLVSFAGLGVGIYGSLEGETTMAIIGNFVFLSGKTWGIISAVNTAEDYNKKSNDKFGVHFKNIKLPNKKTHYVVTLSYNF